MAPWGIPIKKTERKSRGSSMPARIAGKKNAMRIRARAVETETIRRKMDGCLIE